MLNVSGKSEELLKTAIFGVVKIAAAIISALFFIDHIGRKRTLISGVLLQLLALLYVEIFVTAWDAQNQPQSGNARRPADGAIAAIYATGIGYAFGWNSIQYLINAEILPSPVRTLGTSFLMCIHYANKFALVKIIFLPCLSCSERYFNDISKKDPAGLVYYRAKRDEPKWNITGGYLQSL